MAIAAGYKLNPEKVNTESQTNPNILFRIFTPRLQN